MAQCPRSVLLVAYHFPPMGGSGVQRPLKFVRYLPDCGWRPIVLCAGHRRYPLADDSLLAEIPAVAHVERHLGWEPAGLAERLQRMGTRVRGLVRNERASLIRTATVRERRETLPLNRTATVRERSAANGTWRHAMTRRIYWRLQRWAERAPLPEPEWLWARSAVRTAERLARRFRVDAVMTSGGPFTTHLIGLWLKRRLGLPWLAEFRDPLIGNFAARPRNKREAAYWRWLEHDVLHKADEVIVTCDELADDLCARHAALDPARVAVITNGHDEVDFSAAPDEVPPQPDSPPDFMLAHVGAFYRGQSIAPILDALRLMLSRRPEWIGRFRFEIVGSLSAEQRVYLRADDARFVIERGYVKHAQAVAAMRRATALFLTAPQGPGGRLCIPAKTFEYLASGRPIFAAIPRGTQLERLLHRAGGAYVAVARTPEAMATELERFCGGVALGVWEGRRRPAAIRPYTREELTRRLSELLERCVVRGALSAHARASTTVSGARRRDRKAASLFSHHEPTASRWATPAVNGAQPPSAVSNVAQPPSAVSRGTGFQAVRAIPTHYDTPAPLFIYHAVAPDDSSFHDDGYVLRQSLFEHHLDVLVREAAHGRRTRALLSFDDGCRSWVDPIAPRLIARDLSAIFFVIADSASRHRGSRAMTAALTWKHLRELADDRRSDGSQRFEIGSHGLRHVNLAHLLARRGPKAVLRELTDARRRIEDALSRPVAWLALPGGKAGDDPVARRTLRQLAGEAGYRRVRDSTPHYDRDPDLDFAGGSPVYSHTTAAMVRFEILRLHRGRWLNAAARGWLRATGRWIERADSPSQPTGCGTRAESPCHAVVRPCHAECSEPQAPALRASEPAAQAAGEPRDASPCHATKASALQPARRRRHKRRSTEAIECT